MTATNARTEEIKRFWKEQAELLTDVTDTADLLASTDLVVGAGGVSLFERVTQSLKDIGASTMPGAV